MEIEWFCELFVHATSYMRAMSSTWRELIRDTESCGHLASQVEG